MNGSSNQKIGYLKKRELLFQFPVSCVLFTFITRFFIWCFLLFISLLLSLDGFGQPGGEIGVMAGGSYYLGEFNPAGHFRNTQGYLGGFYRYNLNDRFAFRANAGISEINVQNVCFPDNGGVALPSGFRRTVADFGGLVEFNFRSFLVKKTPKSSFWTPYIFTGIGLLAMKSENAVNIPMGVGIKLNLLKQISCGIEWGARKTFTDTLDGLSDPWKTGETNFIYNKDWLFVAGITISYRFPTEPECYQ